MPFQQALDASDLATEVRDMAAAKPSVALSKLKRSPADALDLEETQKIKTENQRWMLSVMHHLDRGDKQVSSNGNGVNPGSDKLELPKQQKILAAYEPRCNS